MEHIEPVLFFDPQRQKEAFCPVCGGCIYPPSYFCTRCERSDRDDFDRIEPLL